MAFDQFGFQAELLGDGGRQPGGPFVKASLNAVCNPNERFPFLIFYHNRLLSAYLNCIDPSTLQPGHDFLNRSALVLDDLDSMRH
jgi:hypothetical protein